MVAVKAHVWPMLFQLVLSSSCSGPNLLQSWVADGFCLTQYASGLSNPRDIVAFPNGDIAVLTAGDNSIVRLRDVDGDGSISNAEKLVLVRSTDLNHALIFHDGYLYASGPADVYRWPYVVGDDFVGAKEAIVQGIGSGGEFGLHGAGNHRTRSLAVIDTNIFVQIGSRENVDTDTDRTSIRSFPLLNIPPGGHTWNSGIITAFGLRNEVALDVDPDGILWGAENGADNLFRDDLGGDIHDDNPGEEINRFDPAAEGLFYGYPYCFSAYDLDLTRVADDVIREAGGVSVIDGPGTQWAWPTTINEFSDEWCRNEDNVVPPVLVLPAHTAPLGMAFAPASFPSMAGDLFVAMHGAWNRDPPHGFKVVRVPYGRDGEGKWMPRDAPQEFLRSQGEARDWGIRPVSLSFSPPAPPLTTASSPSLFVTADAKCTWQSLNYGLGAHFANCQDGIVIRAERLSSAPTPVPTPLPTPRQTGKPTLPPTREPTDTAQPPPASGNSNNNNKPSRASLSLSLVRKGRTSVTLQWSDLPQWSGKPASHFLVSYRVIPLKKLKKEQNPWTVWSEVKATGKGLQEVEVADLARNARYAFRVSAVGPGKKPKRVRAFLRTRLGT